MSAMIGTSLVTSFTSRFMRFMHLTSRPFALYFIVFVMSAMIGTSLATSFTLALRSQTHRCLSIGNMQSTNHYAVVSLASMHKQSYSCLPMQKYYRCGTYSTATEALRDRSIRQTRPCSCGTMAVRDFACSCIRAAPEVGQILGLLF